MTRAADPPSIEVERFELGELELLVIDVPSSESMTAAAAQLSASQRDVARLAIAGLSNKQIAAQRGTSTKTVANQLRAIYLELGIASRFELAAKLGAG